MNQCLVKAKEDQAELFKKTLHQETPSNKDNSYKWITKNFQSLQPINWLVKNTKKQTMSLCHQSVQAQTNKIPSLNHQVALSYNNCSNLYNNLKWKSHQTIFKSCIHLSQDQMQMGPHVLNSTLTKQLLRAL